jgi:dihydrofolate synthase / folylpolyglutamate synthase
MTDAEFIASLFRRTTDGIRWGLERTEALLAGVGDPHRRFQSVHIGGTNGKGSVAVLCAAAVARSPTMPRVGLYTSPHLVDFRERIRIDGVPVSAELLSEAIAELRPGIEHSEATFFEATTALAFLCFAKADVDVAVVEVGMGGRLDATNVVTPLVSVVTNVALDHTEHLGATVARIAAEKAGIFKADVPALTAETDPGALTVLRRHAQAVGAPFATVPECTSLEDLEHDGAATSFVLESAYWGRLPLRIGMPGRHQACNAALAAETVALLPPALRPSPEALAAAFERARWPGRLQWVRAWGTQWLLDVAHNPAGVQALAQALDAIDARRPRVLLCSILGDKDWQEMLPALIERVDATVLTIAPSSPASRRWDVDAVARVCGATGPVRPIAEFEQALHRASTLAAHGTVIVAGSVFTVGDAMRLLGASAEQSVFG